jgi:hypothetical protein
VSEQSLDMIGTIAATLFFTGIVCCIVYKIYTDFLRPVARHGYKLCTSAAYRAKVTERIKKQETATRAFRARAKFDAKRHDWDDDRRSLDDLNPLVIGSTAWLIQQNLTMAFNSTSSKDDFHTSLHKFDDRFSNNFNPTSPFDHNNSMSDWVTGGTDMTGGHGMAGHHDQVPSSSFSSSDPFA